MRRLPCTPGGEVAGVVKELGEGTTGFARGDRVLASTGWGGFAEEIACDATRVFAIPAEMGVPDGAAFLMTQGTSHYALKDRAAIRPGETLAVLGAAGGVGLAAGELGELMCARGSAHAPR